MHKKGHLAKSLESSVGQKIDLEELNKSLESVGLSQSEEFEVSGSKKIKLGSGVEDEAVILSNTTSKPVLGTTGESALIGFGSMQDYSSGKLKWATGYYGFTSRGYLTQPSNDQLTSSEFKKQYKTLSCDDIELIQQMQFFGGNKMVLVIIMLDKNKYSFEKMPKNMFYKYLNNTGWKEQDIRQLEMIDHQYDRLAQYDLEVPVNQLIFFDILNPSLNKNEGGVEETIIIEHKVGSLLDQMVFLKVKVGCGYTAIDAFIEKINKKLIKIDIDTHL
jgi:hypothetical protein